MGFLLSAKGKLVKGFRAVPSGLYPKVCGLVREFPGNLGRILGFVW